MSEYEIGKDIQDLQSGQAELYQRISTLEQELLMLRQDMIKPLEQQFDEQIVEEEQPNGNIKVTPKKEDKKKKEEEKPVVVDDEGVINGDDDDMFEGLE